VASLALDFGERRNGLPVGFVLQCECSEGKRPRSNVIRLHSHWAHQKFRVNLPAQFILWSSLLCHRVCGKLVRTPWAVKDSVSQYKPTFRRFYGIVFQLLLYCNWAWYWTILITVYFSTSRDSVVRVYATGWTPEESPISGRDKRPTRPGLGPTQPPTQLVLGPISPEVKRPGLEADHSPQSSAQVKNERSYISTPPYVFMASTAITLPYYLFL
jgi:hypothetical protein